MGYTEGCKLAAESLLIRERHISILSTRNVIWTLGGRNAYICMLIIRSSLCPKCTIFFLHNTQTCKINNREKCVTFQRGGEVGGGVGGLQKNVHMTFLMDKIDM